MAHFLNKTPDNLSCNINQGGMIADDITSASDTAIQGLYDYRAWSGDGSTGGSEG